jgi:hypothetical protein
MAFAVVLGLGAGLAHAQVLPRAKTVEGYVVTAEIKALAPTKAAPGGAPEAQALAASLGQTSHATVKAWLAQTLSRIEIVSPDFILPAGTLVMHDAGERQYLLVNPKDKTYVVMDADALVSAIEGSVGVVNSQYLAQVHHTHESKAIAGQECRRAILTVTYASSMPFETDRILVQEKSSVEIWHMPATVSAAGLDHLFFKFRGDETKQVQKVVGQELGFPMEVNFVVTPAQAGAKAAAQPGSFHLVVTQIQAERLDPQMFTMPPAGYQRLERNPYFKAAARQ